MIFLCSHRKGECMLYLFMRH